MQWWCAARDVAWRWAWQPYPGVWLFIFAVAFAYTRLRQLAPVGPGDSARRRTAYFATGLFLLWAALDWPVGALGAGYLATAHMVQFLLIALASPPLLLLGLPRAVVARIHESRAGRWIALATQPLLALLVFNASVIATHLPVVTDTLMRTQAGSFLIDCIWLTAGLLYWWPVLVQLPARPRFTPPVRMIYLFASMVFMTAPGAMITFSKLPIYGIYELAPPIGLLSALDDQRLAGILMKLGGGAITWTAIAIMFYRWNRDENRLLARDLARVRGTAAG